MFKIAAGYEHDIDEGLWPNYNKSLLMGGIPDENALRARDTFCGMILEVNPFVADNKLLHAVLSVQLLL